jgi:hypothetical protein
LPIGYLCRFGDAPDGANTEFGIVQRLIKLGSLTGCDTCNKKACFLLVANREGGQVLPGGASLSYRSIGVLEKKIQKFSKFFWDIPPPRFHRGRRFRQEPKRDFTDGFCGYRNVEVARALSANFRCMTCQKESLTGL